MADLSLDNIYNVSVSAAGRGVGQFNTSNLAILSHEVPALSFGDEGYKIYQSPNEVAEDFGTGSITYALSVAVYSQQPNIKANRGYLVVFTKNTHFETLDFSNAVAGGFDLEIGDHVFPVSFDTSPSQLQSALRLVPDLAHAVVDGVAGSFDISLDGAEEHYPAFSILNNTLENMYSEEVVPVLTKIVKSERAADAILRTSEMVQYFGMIFTQEFKRGEYIAAAEAVAPLRKILFLAATGETDNDENGKISTVTEMGISNARGIYRTLAEDQTELEALRFAAAYAGRGLSVNFGGSDTTITMHLKDIVGLTADKGITESILQKCKDSGADVYASFRGIPKVFTSGANKFFDQVYNLFWFIETAQVAAVNVLARTSTKIPQTEGGMDLIKGAVKKVCEQSVTNGYVFAGEWTSPDSFGVYENFMENIRQYGYYIYSGPIALQDPEERKDRIAPLVQIALKEKGAIHGGNILIYINE